MSLFFLISVFLSTVFNGCVYGVLANTVNTEVKQCRFRNMLQYGIKVQNNSYGSTKINENRIEARSYGVYCLLNDPYFDQSITNNKITVGGSLGFGIYVSESGLPPLDTTSGTINFIGRNNVVVQQNAICGIFANSMQGARIASDTVYLLNHLMAQAGITLTGCTKLLVSDNIIKGKSPLTSNQGIYPVGILSAGSTDGIIKCNTTDSTYQGMVFNGNNTGTRIALNQLSRHYIGMRVTQGGSISPQWQISPNVSIPYYNTFTPGTFASWAAVHEDTNNYVYQKIFVPFTSTQGGADGYWPAVGKISPPDWFDQGFEIPLNCGSNLREIENPDSLDAWESRIAAGQAAFSIYTPELKWQHERYLFEKIKDNESLQAADEEAAVFFAAQAASSKGALEQVETMLEESEQTVADSIFLLLRLQQSKLLEIAALDSLYAPAENDTTETLWMLPAAADSVKETLKEVTYALESVQRQVKAKSSQNAANAADNNKKIVTDGFVAENETRYNAVFTATKARGIAELNTGAQDTIRQLACQCPLKGGRAVYKARSLYALVKDTVYDDLAMCNEVGMIHYKTDETKTEIVNADAQSLSAFIFPNPAKSLLYIAFSSKINTVVSIEMAGMLGEIVKEKTLLLNGGVISMDVSELPANVYLVKIKLQDNPTNFVHRLVITK